MKEQSFSFKIVNAKMSFIKDAYLLSVLDSRCFVIKYIISTKRGTNGIYHEEEKIAELLIKDARDGFENYENLNKLIAAVIMLIAKNGREKKSIYIDQSIVDHFNEVNSE